MSRDKSDAFTTEPEGTAHHIRLTGTGAAVPTVSLGGKLVSIARAGVGDVTLTWRDHPGTLVSMNKPALQAATPANVKNCDVTPGSFSASAKTLQLLIWSSAGAARDLAANEFINLTVWFKETGV